MFDSFRCVQNYKQPSKALFAEILKFSFSFLRVHDLYDVNFRSNVMGIWTLGKRLQNRIQIFSFLILGNSERLGVDVDDVEFEVRHVIEPHV